MFSFLLIAALQFLNAYATGTGKTTFFLRIKENQARYVQKTEVDFYRNHVYYHTPAHNAINESLKMQDFQREIELICLTKACFVKGLNRALYPDGPTTVKNIASKWLNGSNSIDDGEKETIHQRFYIEPNEIKDTTFMGPEMREFFEAFGLPLYRIHDLPNDAEIITNNGHNKRTTGPSNFLTRTCSSGSPSKKYGYTVGACDNLHFCNIDKCGDRHVVSATYYVCLCCPGQDTTNTCLDCRVI